MRWLAATLLSLVLLGTSAVQQGHLQPENSPTLTLSIDGSPRQAKAVLDANWRWVHKSQGYENCFTSAWVCDDCDSCELEGVSQQQYLQTYGVDSQGSQLTLRFVTGSNVGSRLYLADDHGYLPITPLNHRISFDLDLSQVPCGVNAAVYLVNMSSTLPELGVGYGDAQCPTDIKYFGSGAVNRDHQAVCALELDLTEANREAMAWTLHPCVGTNCDKAGADMNAFRQGFPEFYGPGKTVDTKQPFTVVTEFREDSMRRYYRQNGQIHEHPTGPLTAESAARWAANFGEQSVFEASGGFPAFWAQGTYVLVVSIWDDPATGMQWLDGSTGSGPGGARGPCAPSQPRSSSPNAFYTFANLRIEKVD
jgi:cellulose 1,4-beta-cellobiosidase